MLKFSLVNADRCVPFAFRIWENKHGRGGVIYLLNYLFRLQGNVH